MSNPKRPDTMIVMQREWIRELLDILRRPMRDPDNDAWTRQYHVQRGGIPWASFDWPYDYAVEVKVAELDYADESQTKLSAFLVLNAATRMKSENDAQADVNLDAMLEDMNTAMYALNRLQHPSKARDLVLRFNWEGAVEWFDNSLKIQGVRQTYLVIF